MSNYCTQTANYANGAKILLMSNPLKTSNEAAFTPVIRNFLANNFDSDSTYIDIRFTGNQIHVLIALN